MLDFLKCKIEHNQYDFKIVLVKENDICIAALPINIIPVKPFPTLLYYLKILVVSSGSPLAIKSAYHKELCQKLLKHLYMGMFKPLMLVLARLKTATHFLRWNFQK